ncbi:MAG TPA: hypothetical protein VHC22_06305 [Pirellulales bacterium]|nr:hypothetical protein [Pirellulales bacterium]
MLLLDPVMRAILRGTSPIQVLCPLFVDRRRQFRRLADYRLAQLQKVEADLVWDNRLAALLTRDEYDFLYGRVTPPVPPAVTDTRGCPDSR